MAGSLYYHPRPQEQNSSGDALGGALLYCYTVGTTTLKSAYTTSALSVAHANPVVADSAGRFAAIYMDGDYKFVLKDSAGITIWTEDDVRAVAGQSRFGTTTAITTTTTLDSTYANKHLRCTGTITLNLQLVATAGEGFVFSVINDGTGTVTIDPNGSEEINDASTLAISPGGSGIVIASTTEWSFIGTKALTAALDEVQTYTKAKRVTATALTSTTNSIALDLSLNNDFSHTFTENTTLANPSNIVAGQSGAIRLTQHASAPKTLAYGSQYKFSGGAVPAVTATNSAIDTLYYSVRSATIIECNLVKGFA